MLSNDFYQYKINIKTKFMYLVSDFSSLYLNLKFCYYYNVDIYIQF